MKRKDKANIRSLQIRMLIVYVIVLFLGIHMITSMIIDISNDILFKKVSSLAAANCQQIELNINNYLNNVEAITTLLFADEKYYKYDPTSGTYDEYTKIKNEKEIADRIVDLGLMQNFTDFAVVYSNGNRVGWTSNTTAGLFDAEDLYKTLSNAVTDSRTEDGWTFLVGGVTDRIYYVKRLNKNAVLMASFYSRELETAFKYPAELEGMVINLVNEDNVVLYSSEADNIGVQLDDEIAQIISGQDSSDYIVNVNKCENDWRVVCAIPTATILREENLLKYRAIMYSLIVAIVMIVVGLVIFTRLFKPVDSAVEELKEEAVMDKLSGLYNKQSFNSEVHKHLSGTAFETTRAFIMIDVDNFKQINDTLGHAYGDEFIVRMGKLLSSQFTSEYIIGRVGGDEFAIYTEDGDKDVTTERDKIIEEVNKLFNAFDIEFSKEKNEVNVSLSIGIAVLSNERRFESLYKAADEALYISKKSGKNRYTIYDKKEEE